MQYLNSKTTRVLGIIIILCTGCIASPDSGPCDYHPESFNMKIIDVVEDTTNPNHYNVWVDFDGNIPYTGRPYLFEKIRNVLTSKQFISKNNIKPGNVYTGVLYVRMTDRQDCESEIFDWNQHFTE